MDSEESRKQLDKAIERREYWRHKAFVLMLEIAFIIGLPAILAAFIGRKLDDGQGSTYTVLFSAVAIVISWTVIIIKYRKYSTAMKQADEDVKKFSQNQKKQEIKNND